MKYASEDLLNEHEGILFGLRILEKITELLKKGKKIEKKEISEIVNFFKLFADKCHHGKEEGLLFPAMENVGIKKENGPIGQMLVEHSTSRKYIFQMTEAHEFKTFDKELFIKSASQYILLLRSHIEKENTILFPMGDKLIPRDQQKKLLELFEKHEEEVMGKGTHEKLHEMLNVFQKKYLKE